MTENNHNDAIKYLANSLLDKIKPLVDDWSDFEEIVICSDRGFGHQLSGPDLYRRYHNGKKCLFIFLDWPLRHNSFVSIIWSKIRVVNIPLIQRDMFGLASGYAGDFLLDLATYACKALQEYLGHRLRGRVCLYNDFILEITSQVQVFKDRGEGFAWFLKYYDILKKTEMPKRKIGEPVKAKILEFFKNEHGIDLSSERFFTMYIRQKFGPTDSSVRSGSATQDYGPAIQYLLKKGYHGFVIGDVVVQGIVNHAAVYAREAVEKGYGSPMADILRECDPDNFALSWSAEMQEPELALRRILELFFTTECAMFIGEAGGAAQLTPFDNIPTLLTNVVPYAYAAPSSVMLYKPLVQDDGALIPYQQLFTTHRLTYEAPNVSFRSNSALEILDAVQTMEMTLDQHPFGVKRDRLQGLPEDMLIGYCDAAISPAFFRIYEREK